MTKVTFGGDISPFFPHLAAVLKAASSAQLQWTAVGAAQQIRAALHHDGAPADVLDYVEEALCKGLELRSHSTGVGIAQLVRTHLAGWPVPQ